MALAPLGAATAEDRGGAAPPQPADDWLLQHRRALPAPGFAPPYPGAVQARPYAGRGDGDRWGHHRDGFAGAAAGFAAGALLGGALAAQPGYYNPPADDYYAEAPPDAYPVEADAATVDYCFRRYRSYDPRSGTYVGYDGYRHPCP